MYTQNSLSFSDLLDAVNIGYLYNVVLPAKLGDLVRAVVLSKRCTLSKREVFASIILERFFEVGSLACVIVLSSFVISVWVKHEYTDSLYRWSYVLLLIILLGMPLGLGSFFRFKRILDEKKYENRLSKIAIKYMTYIHPLVSSLRNTRRPIYALTAIVLSFLLWFVNAILMKLGLIALGAEIGFSSAILVLVFFIFGGILPTGPGAVGAPQVSLAIGCSLIGLDREIGMALGIILAVCGGIFSICLGLGSISRIEMKISVLRKEAEFYHR